ncbi:MAG: hypothetical protein PHP63_07290 [Candidatus Marinimicrobia bacterium]|nr:hypothetical protein [Candidatus Neomarinimicrobiota bacterium]
MTQIEKQSVRNAEAAENINRIPTFEEVYAMPYVRESIESLLDQNVRRYSLLSGFKDDLRQEILIHLNVELTKYDPDKSSIQTFARMAILSGLRMARRNYFTRDNCTLAFAQDVESFEQHDDDSASLNEEDCRAYAAHGKNDVELKIQERDIETVMCSLPQELRNIARMLLDGDSVLCVCRRLGIANSTFRDNQLRQLRKFFNERFFEKNSEKSVN